MVRNVLCAAVVLLGAATRPAFAAESPMPTIDGDTKFWAYETAHSDEFDAAGAISAAKWTQELGEWKGTPPGAFKQGNAAISSGKQLVLTSKNDAGFVPAGIDENCDCGFGDISTPLVVSSSFLTYGFYEVRAKMAKASLLSSFWLQGESGEINILDTVPASINNGLKVSNNYHCFDPAGDGSKTEDDENTIGNLDPSDGFHTYGVERQASGVKFYVDGKLVRTLTSNTVSDASCLQQPMSVIFSMETIESEGIPSAFNTHTSNLEYFRFWSHSTAPPVTPSPPTPPPSGPARKTCAELGWSVGLTKGDTTACGESDNKLGTNGATTCHSNKNFEDAQGICSAAGSRLCTATEIQAGVTRGSGCGFDNKEVWSSTPCATGYTVVTGRGGTERCLPTSDVTVEVRCCSDVTVTTNPSPSTPPVTPAPPTPPPSGPVTPSPPTPPPSGPARKTCAELGWRVGLTKGDTTACGESDNKLGTNGATTCHSNKNFEDAQGICSAAGSRLCTATEIQAEVTRGSGCGFDNKEVWSSTPCATGYTVVKGKGGTERCLPTSDVTVEVRCCADVTNVAFLAASMAGSISRGDVQHAEISLSALDMDANGADGGVSAGATVAAALAAAVVVLGALAAVVMRRRSGAAAAADSPDAPAHNEEGAAELGNSTARRQSKSYRGSVASVDMETERGEVVDLSLNEMSIQSPPEDAIDDNAFVLTDKGTSIRMKSVRRGNPLYVQSMYVDSPEHGPASMAASTDM